MSNEFSRVWRLSEQAKNQPIKFLHPIPDMEFDMGVIHTTDRYLADMIMKALLVPPEHLHHITAPVDRSKSWESLLLDS